MCLDDIVVFTPAGHAYATKLAEKPPSPRGDFGWKVYPGPTLSQLRIEASDALEVMVEICPECYGESVATCPRHAFSWRRKLTLAEVCMCTALSMRVNIQHEWPGLSKPGSGEISSRLMDAPRCSKCGGVRPSRITALST